MSDAPKKKFAIYMTNGTNDPLKTALAVLNGARPRASRNPPLAPCALRGALFREEDARARARARARLRPPSAVCARAPPPSSPPHPHLPSVRSLQALHR